MRIRAITAVTALVSALSAVASPASAAAPTALGGLPDCPGERRVGEFHAAGIPLLDWRENLEFDGRGTMWVSHVTGSRIEGYGPDGSLRASLDLPSPGGIRRGADGNMYVNFGIGPAAASSGIARFDPAAPVPVATTVVDGLSGINGLAIDGRGNFYLGREFAPYIQKIRPDGTEDAEWTKAATVFGTNGVAVDGGTLYSSALTDPRSPVEEVPLDAPAAHRTLAEFSSNPLRYKGLDDLAVTGEHVVSTGFISGELLRADRSTGGECVLLRGLRAPTSVRVPVGFGDAAPARELFVTEASGRILRVTV